MSVQTLSKAEDWCRGGRGKKVWGGRAGAVSRFVVDEGNGSGVPEFLIVLAVRCGGGRRWRLADALALLTKAILSCMVVSKKSKAVVGGGVREGGECTAQAGGHQATYVRTTRVPLVRT